MCINIYIRTVNICISIHIYSTYLSKDTLAAHKKRHYLNLKLPQLAVFCIYLHKHLGLDFCQGRKRPGLKRHFTRGKYSLQSWWSRFPDITIGKKSLVDSVKFWGKYTDSGTLKNESWLNFGKKTDLGWDWVSQVWVETKSRPIEDFWRPTREWLKPDSLKTEVRWLS